MSSNKNKINRLNFKFKNQRLYRRITFTFSTMFLSVTLLSLISAVAFCIFLLMNISKNNFESYSTAVIQAVVENKQAILQQDEEDRVQFIVDNYIFPVSDAKREVSYKILDEYSQLSNDKNFDIIMQYVPQIIHQSGSSEKFSIKKFEYEKNIYHYLSVDISLDSYVLRLTTYQNIQDNYIYTVILTVAIGAAFLIVGISLLSFGRILTRKALEPLEKIAEAVKSISEENLFIEIEPSENDDRVDSLIIALNNMLQRLNISFEEQTRFVSDVSHELRIPITIIQGYVDIIQTWGKNDEKIMNESLDAIFTETTNMKNLVEKLLLLQNLDSGNYNFEMEQIDVNQLLRKSIFETRMLTQEHTVIEKLSPIDPCIVADKGLLAQAIRSVIDNSMKYTNAGGTITISSSCDRHKVYIQISDSGCGIEKEHISKVKQRFYRVDSARTKKTGGSGLGLSIVNAIINAMGGELIIKSEINKGSTVIFALPRK